MHAILITGWRRTGKDTLCSQLRNPSAVISDHWQIYRAPNSTKEFPVPSDQVKRVALADILKEEVHAELEREGITIANPEEWKDKHLPNGKILRDLYMQRGLQRRQEDIHYWCRQALAKHIDSGDYLHNTLCVTDFRFPDELEYFSKVEYIKNITTIRVYRSAVPVPPADVASEHSVDALSPDFILCAHGDEAQMKKVFPQCRTYELIIA